MFDDDGKLSRKLANKRVNAKKAGVECYLTETDIVELMKIAGIKSLDWGFTGNNYVLARHNDQGDYTIDNCEFKTQLENVKERVLTEKAIESNRNNGLIGLSVINASEEILERRDSSLLLYQERRRIDAKIKREEKEKMMDSSKIGNKNSQFGSYWINDGHLNKKWKDDKGDIPAGFVKGRLNVTQSWNK